MYELAILTLLVALAWSSHRRKTWKQRYRQERHAVRALTEQLRIAVEANTRRGCVGWVREEAWPDEIEG